MSTGHFLISDTFKVTGRGLVLVGCITAGVVSVGNEIEFGALGTTYRRMILGVESIRKSPPDEFDVGIIIKCADDSELEHLRNWKPDQVAAVVHKK